MPKANLSSLSGAYVYEGMASPQEEKAVRSQAAASRRSSWRKSKAGNVLLLPGLFAGKAAQDDHGFQAHQADQGQHDPGQPAQDLIYSRQFGDFRSLAQVRPMHVPQPEDQ